MLATWCSAVRRLMYRRSPISAFERPAASRDRTSVSRSGQRPVAPGPPAPRGARARGAGRPRRRRRARRPGARTCRARAAPRRPPRPGARRRAPARARAAPARPRAAGRGPRSPPAAAEAGGRALVALGREHPAGGEVGGGARPARRRRRRRARRAGRASPSRPAIAAGELEPPPAARAAVAQAGSDGLSPSKQRRASSSASARSPRASAIVASDRRAVGCHSLPSSRRSASSKRPCRTRRVRQPHERGDALGAVAALERAERGEQLLLGLRPAPDRDQDAAVVAPAGRRHEVASRRPGGRPPTSTARRAGRRRRARRR